MAPTSVEDGAAATAAEPPSTAAGQGEMTGDEPMARSTERSAAKLMEGKQPREDEEQPPSNRKQQKAQPSPKRRGRPRKTDPDAPKRAVSAYNYFMKEMRPKVRAEHPDSTFGEVAALLGQRWKDMSDQEKRPYQKQAEADKFRHAREMEAYRTGEWGKRRSKQARENRDHAARRKWQMENDMALLDEEEWRQTYGDDDDDPPRGKKRRKTEDDANEKNRGWALNQDDDIVVGGATTTTARGGTAVTAVASEAELGEKQTKNIAGLLQAGQRGSSGTDAAAAASSSAPAAAAAPAPPPILAIRASSPGATIMEVTSSQRRCSRCICGTEECRRLLKAFRSLNDIRGQFFTTPKMGLTRAAGIKTFKLDRTIHHLNLGEGGEPIEELRQRFGTLDGRVQTETKSSEGAGEGDRGGNPKERRGARQIRWLACHHFHPQLLQEMVINQGKRTFDFVDVDLVRRLGLEGNGYTEDDLFRGQILKVVDRTAEVYVPVPTYSAEDARRDYISCSSRRRLDALVAACRSKEQVRGESRGEGGHASANDGGVEDDACIEPIEKLPQLDMDNAMHMQRAISLLADEGDRLKEKIRQLEERLEAEQAATAAREEASIEKVPSTNELLQAYLESGDPFFVQAVRAEDFVVPEDGTVLEFTIRTHHRAVVFKRDRFVPGICFGGLRRKIGPTTGERLQVFKRPGMWKDDKKSKHGPDTKALIPRNIIEVCLRERGMPEPTCWTSTGGDASPHQEQTEEAADDGYYGYHEE